MLIFAVAILIASAAAEILDGPVNIEDKFEPQVAFLCGYPSRYLTTAGWQLDRTQACLSNAANILDYCLLKYPLMNITNIIPASSQQNISGWGSFNNPNDAQVFTVRPYRCVVGNFESDALLVPDPCIFSHYEANLEDNDKTNAGTVAECASYEEWNTIAARRCVANNNLTLYSFSVLLPCSPGSFAGVEYVCCPSNSPNSQSGKTDIDSVFDNMPKPQVIDSVPTSDQNDIADDRQSTLAPQAALSDDAVENEDDDDLTDLDMYEEEGEDLEDHVDDITPGQFAGYDPKKNYYVMYMETPELLGATEHEVYTKAVRFVRHYYETLKERLIMQLDELKDRTDQLEIKNVSAAQSLREQGSKTLEELYETTDATWKKVKQAMYDEHNRRVQLRLEDTRLDRVENLMNALDEAAEFDDLQAIPPLMKALKQYIRSEEKERIQWINRYEHLLDTNPSEAERIKLTVQEMLIQIQQRLATITDSLKRVPRIESTVHSLLKEFLASYADVDQEIRLLFPDLDLNGDVERMLPSLRSDDYRSSVTKPAPIEIMKDYEPSPSSNAAEVHYQPRRRDNIIVIVSVGATVLVSVLVIAMALLCTRCCRRTLMLHRRAPAKPTNIFVVNTAANETGKLDPLDVTFDSVPSSRSIVRSAHGSLRRMQMRGYENPGHNAHIAFNDDEGAALVERDVLQLQS